VTRADGLPGHICCECKHKLDHLEKAAEELESFRSDAKNTYSTLALKRNELKQTKETSSSVGVSPDTLRSRSPAKKLTRRHLEFENGKNYDNQHKPLSNYNTIICWRKISHQR
jgi:hypothetical protein